MRKDIITDNFMGDSKDKYKSSIRQNNIIKYKFKTGDKYIANIDSIFFREYRSICQSLKIKFDSLTRIFKFDMESINSAVSAELYEAEKSNLIRVVDTINNDTGIRNIIIYPSHKLKKHLYYEYTDTKLILKFREGTSTTVNSDVIESIYQLYDKAMFAGKELKDKTQIFIDGINYLNNSKIYNNGIDYHIFYKLEGYNTIIVGIENDFFDYPKIEVYEESLVGLSNRRIFITPTETSKSIRYYLDSNPTKDDLSIVKLILQDYNLRHKTKYKLHSSNRFVYMEDDDIDDKIQLALSQINIGTSRCMTNMHCMKYRIETDNMIVISLDII